MEHKIQSYFVDFNTKLGELTERKEELLEDFCEIDETYRAEVERMLVEIAILEKAKTMSTTWKSCKDEPPKDGDFALCLTEFGDYHVCVYCKIENHPYCNIDGWYSKDNDGSEAYDIRQLGITHWWPVPAPPKKENVNHG